MRVDLHTHTTASDGRLSPAELVRAAAAARIEVLAITDHDTTDAHQPSALPDSPGLTLIRGVELSTAWRGVGVHVLGLDIDPGCERLREGIRAQRRARRRRAAQIARRLERLGIECPLPRVEALAGNGCIGRPHFARFLVASGVVRTVDQAFRKYLASGRPAAAGHAFAPLAQVVDWVREAGGTAVLAHPAKYKLSRTKLLALVDDFIDAGGVGLEVISGRQGEVLTRALAALCVERGLLASCGSDFHEPGQPWAELGQGGALPNGCRPVWDRW